MNRTQEHIFALSLQVALAEARQAGAKLLVAEKGFAIQTGDKSYLASSLQEAKGFIACLALSAECGKVEPVGAAKPKTLKKRKA